MNDLALIAAAAGLVLRWLTARRMESRLRLAVQNYEGRVAWVGAYQERMFREVLTSNPSALHPLEIPANGVKLYAAVGRYKGSPAVKLLKELKAGGVHGGRRAAMVGSIAQTMINALDILRPDITTITSAPSTPTNQAGRGYDYMAEIAQAVANAYGVPYSRLLEKKAGALSQVAVRSRAARLESVKQSIRARGSLSPLRVLVIDDVSTTGATIEACADALRNAGAADVMGLCLASDRR